MKHVIYLLAALTMFQAAAFSGPMSEDQKVEAAFSTFLDEEFRQRPVEATKAGDHRFDGLLDDVSPAARKKNTERLQKTFDELPQRIDYKKLSRNAQIDYEIWRHHLQRELWLAANTQPFQTDPRLYNDYITESVYLLLTQSTAPPQDNLRNSLARMKQVPRIIVAAKENLKNPPRVFVETAIKQNRGAISFYETGLFELAGETPQLSGLKEDAKIITSSLREYQSFLEKDLLPRANGEWRLGKERFAQKLELELDAGITSEEVLHEAEAEADRVRNDMYVIARQLWSQVFAKKPLPPDTEEGRFKTITDVLAEVCKEHGQAKDLVKDVQATAESIKVFIKEKDILRLPDPDACKIIEMPEFQRGNYAAYLNPAPPLDSKAASYYAISPPPADWDARRVETFLQEYNRHMIQVLTIHEAYPGHYVQLAYANKNPSLIRKLLYSGVFAEGWAVYTEQMMLDQGYGNNNLALRLNQLKWYLRSVCNAILDYKMHCTNMTDEEALAFLMTKAFQSEAETILKIIRAKQSSCQLSTYFVGRTAFQRLRRRYQTELGENFELGRFHEAVLAHGTLPVKYLPELVGERLKQVR